MIKSIKDQRHWSASYLLTSYCEWWWRSITIFCQSSNSFGWFQMRDFCWSKQLPMQSQGLFHEVSLPNKPGLFSSLFGSPKQIQHSSKLGYYGNIYWETNQVLVCAVIVAYFVAMLIQRWTQIPKISFQGIRITHRSSPTLFWWLEAQTLKAHQIFFILHFGTKHLCERSCGPVSPHFQYETYNMRRFPLVILTYFTV